MAKGSMAPSPMHGRQSLSRQAWHKADQDNRSETELFSLVQNTDYVPPKRPSKPCAQREDAPLKSRTAIGWLTVNGHEEPVYEPVQGFEHLFVQEAAPWSPPASEPREVQARDTTTTHQPVLNWSSRGVKRNRHDEDNLALAVAAPDTFNVGDIEALKAFYEARFRELTMKPMRDIVTTWVKRLEPKRQQLYGPYLRYRYNSNRPDSHTEKSKRPPWWPAAVPYIEPSHLKLQHLVPLAVDIMLVHRRVDEAAGKRKHASWIAKLQTDALYLIGSKDLDSFSSSKGSKYNKAMKKRALEEILPSLFDVARCHEDYMAQYELYEGYDNEDPGYGKQISWQPASRLKRENKRPCTTIKAEPFPRDYLHNNIGTGPRHPVDQVSTAPATEEREEPKIEPLSQDDIRDDATEVDPEESVYDSVYSSFGSTFSTEDVKMFPSDIPDSLPAPEMVSIDIQPLDRTPIQTPNTNPPVDAGQSKGRLPLSEVDSSTIPSTFEIPTSSASGASIIPSYVYPQQIAQGPLAFQPVNFHALETVAPQDVTNANPLPTNGLPVSGISTHSMPTHGLPAFTMPYISPYDLPMPDLQTHDPLADGPPTDEASSHEPPICLPYDWRFAQAL